MVPTPVVGSGLPTVLEALGATCCPVLGSMEIPPCVLPEMRLSAPGVDGPKTLPKLLSLSA